jgi:hypothetical protein
MAEEYADGMNYRFGPDRPRLRFHVRERTAQCAASTHSYGGSRPLLPHPRTGGVTSRVYMRPDRCFSHAGVPDGHDGP